MVTATRPLHNQRPHQAYTLVVGNNGPLLTATTGLLSAALPFPIATRLITDLDNIASTRDPLLAILCANQPDPALAQSIQLRLNHPDSPLFVVIPGAAQNHLADLQAAGVDASYAGNAPEALLLRVFALLRRHYVLPVSSGHTLRLPRFWELRPRRLG